MPAASGWLRLPICIKYAGVSAEKNDEPYNRGDADNDKASIQQGFAPVHSLLLVGQSELAHGKSSCQDDAPLKQTLQFVHFVATDITITPFGVLH